MEKHKPDSNEYEDIEDCIIAIDDDFKFQFDSEKLKACSNFEELIDLAVSNIDLEHLDDCTSQQAFYKVRKTISETKKADAKLIKHDSKLLDFFSEKKLNSEINEFEQNLGIKLGLVEPVSGVFYVAIVGILLGIAALFFNLVIGISVLLVSFLGLKLSYTFSKRLVVKTIRDLVKKMTTEHYTKVRTYPETVNRNELSDIFWNYFSFYLNTKKEDLNKYRFN